jgi:hypothetical protein
LYKRLEKKDVFIILIPDGDVNQSLLLLLLLMVSRKVHLEIDSSEIHLETLHLDDLN